jgi:hypothetical protein
MDSVFESVLDGLHERILSFDLSNLTMKDIVPLKLKPNMFWCDLFGKTIQDTWKVSLI